MVGCKKGLSIIPFCGKFLMTILSLLPFLSVMTSGTGGIVTALGLIVSVGAITGIMGVDLP